MKLDEYAEKYEGAPKALLQALAGVTGRRSVNAEYRRAAAKALKELGISPWDAEDIAEQLTAEQMRGPLRGAWVEFDDRRSVQSLLAEHPDWSDEHVAKEADVDRDLVKELRG